MSDVLIVAILSFAGTAIGTIVGALVSSKVTDLRLKILENQVGEISKKQDTLYSLDRRISVVETIINEREV